MNLSDEAAIRKVLKADRFEIYYLKFESDTVHIGVINTKFRSQAQAVGRISSTLQGFTSNILQLPTYLFLADLLIDLPVDWNKLP